MASVTQTQVLQDLSFLLGELTVPSSGIEDRQRFIQRALERVYRAYNFPMNEVTATVALVSGLATLPSNLGQDGLLDVRQVLSGTYNDHIYGALPYTEQDNAIVGSYGYWLDGYEGTYVLHSNEADTTLSLRYVTSVPTINASISTPFPSSMALARGALVYYRQSEDPQADIAQEEAIFQQEIDEVIAAYNRNRPQPRGKGLHEVTGTYLGDTTSIGVD